MLNLAEVDKIELENKNCLNESAAIFSNSKNPKCQIIFAYSLFELDLQWFFFF